MASQKKDKFERMCGLWLVVLFGLLLFMVGVRLAGAAPRYVVAATPGCDFDCMAQTESDFTRQYANHSKYAGKFLNDMIVIHVREIVNGYSSWRWNNEQITAAELGLTREQYMAYHRSRADELIQLQIVNGEWIFKDPPGENEWQYIVAAFKQQLGYQDEIPSMGDNETGEENGGETMIPNPQAIEDFIPEKVNEYIEGIRIADDSVKWDKHELQQAAYDAVSGDKKAGLEALKEERKTRKVKIQKKDAI
jgi:hypothetical protein